jgi:hypothetical protein
MKYEDWMKKRVGHNEHITYHPLREEFRQKFNATAAWEWFYTIDKKEYGYRNLIFSWFDTYDDSYNTTNTNSPAGFPSEAWMIIVSIIAKFKPAYVHMMLGEGLLVRLNITDKDCTDVLTIHQIAAEAARRY